MFIDRPVQGLPTIRLAGRDIKRYEVNGPIEPSLWEAAMDFLPKLFPVYQDETAPVTISVLHRGQDAVFLNAYSWVWDNVVYGRFAASGDMPFLERPSSGLTDFAELNQPVLGCVYELPVLEHERAAWVRHMLLPEQADLAGYLADLRPAGLSYP